MLFLEEQTPGETNTLILTTLTFFFHLILLKNLHQFAIFVDQMTGETNTIIPTASTFCFNLIVLKNMY